MATFSVTSAIVAWVHSLGYVAAVRRYKGAPVELVTVERLGGGVRSFVDHPTVAVQCWAEDEARAEDMANDVRLALTTTRPPVGIHSVRVNAGPYPFYDPDTRLPRYQLVLDVSCQLTIDE